MPKKRKLNSKNPKYWNEKLLSEPAIKEKKFMGNIVIRNSNGNIVPGRTSSVHVIWYE